MEIGDGGGESFPQSVPYSILAIDLGETTGIASFAWGSGTVRCTTTDNPAWLFPLISLLQPDEILLERFPSSPMIPYVVEETYQRLMLDAILISPGSWKPFMKSWTRYFPQAKTQHEKDAISILRYYMLTTFKKDIV